MRKMVKFKNIHSKWVVAKYDIGIDFAWEEGILCTRETRAKKSWIWGIKEELERGD